MDYCNTVSRGSQPFEHQGDSHPPIRVVERGPRRGVVATVAERAFRYCPLVLPRNLTVRAHVYVTKPGSRTILFRDIHNSETWEPWQWAMWGSTVANEFVKCSLPDAHISIDEWPSYMAALARGGKHILAQHETPNGLLSTAFMGIRASTCYFYQTTMMDGPCNHWYAKARTAEDAMGNHMAALGAVYRPFSKGVVRALRQLAPLPYNSVSGFKPVAKAIANDFALTFNIAMPNSHRMAL